MQSCEVLATKNDEDVTTQMKYSFVFICMFLFRTLCAALANLEDAEDIVGNQLCLVLQEELVCYKEKRWDTCSCVHVLLSRHRLLWRKTQNFSHNCGSVLNAKCGILSI